MEFPSHPPMCEAGHRVASVLDSKEEACTVQSTLQIHCGWIFECGRCTLSNNIGRKPMSLPERRDAWARAVEMNNLDDLGWTHLWLPLPTVSTWCSFSFRYRSRWTVPWTIRYTRDCGSPCSINTCRSVPQSKRIRWSLLFRSPTSSRGHFSECCTGRVQGMPRNEGWTGRKSSDRLSISLDRSLRRKDRS